LHAVLQHFHSCPLCAYLLIREYPEGVSDEEVQVHLHVHSLPLITVPETAEPVFSSHDPKSCVICEYQPDVEEAAITTEEKQIHLERVLKASSSSSEEDDDSSSGTDAYESDDSSV
jgi:hypothetical protein